MSYNERSIRATELRPLSHEALVAMLVACEGERDRLDAHLTECREQGAEHYQAMLDAQAAPAAALRAVESYRSNAVECRTLEAGLPISYTRRGAVMSAVTHKQVRCEGCLGMGYKGRSRRGQWKIETHVPCRGTGLRDARERQRIAKAQS